MAVADVLAHELVRAEHLLAQLAPVLALFHLEHMLVEQRIAGCWGVWFGARSVPFFFFSWNTKSQKAHGTFLQSIFHALLRVHLQG